MSKLLQAQGLGKRFGGQLACELCDAMQLLVIVERINGLDGMPSYWLRLSEPMEQIMHLPHEVGVLRERYRNAQVAACVEVDAGRKHAHIGNENLRAAVRVIELPDLL